MILVFFLLMLCSENSKCDNSTELIDWVEYVEKFSTFYTDLHINNTVRHQIFEETVQYIQKWNEEYKKGLHTYRLGINPFTAKTKQEKERMNIKIGVQQEDYVNETDTWHNWLLHYRGRVPREYDWRDKGVVSRVKYQGDCAACYAFAVLDVLESKYALKTREYVQMSAQMLIDCTTDVNLGCEGGYVGSTYKYIMNVGGVATEEDYPYKARVGVCREHRVEKPYKVKKMIYLPFANERILKRAVYLTGPVSVAFDSDLSAFQSYRGGIFDDYRCKSIKLSHSGAVVGYGNENGKDYWIVKNSWSKYWGEDGYIRIRRNYDNICGVASYAMFPIIS